MALENKLDAEIIQGDRKEIIARYFEQNASKLDMPSLKSIEVEVLGAGENNLNYLVTVNGAKKYVLRVSNRLRSSKQLVSEFHFLISAI